MVMDGNGSVVWEAEYDSFGIASLNDDLPGSFINNLRLAGQYYDEETGLNYNGFRYYDPEIGRYLTHDPLEEGINPYLYCLNDPLSLVDPLGLSCSPISDIIHTGLGVVGMIPGVGIVADVLDTVVYVAEGDWKGAAMSGVAIIPVIGTAAGAAKTARTASRASSAGRGMNKFGRGASTGFTGANRTPRVGARPSTTQTAAGGGCFTAGTLVLTETGPRPIEDIHPGDMVLSRNEKTGEVELRPVVRAFVREDIRVLELSLKDEHGTVETLGVTAEHPFWVKARGWVHAQNLLPGDEVFTSTGGWLKVSSGTWLADAQTVYNFNVANYHTYFVGELGAWVHNTCKPEAPEGTFNISDWSDYPADVPKPKGPFRKIEGDEYDEARKAANNANRKIRKDENLVGEPVDVHEVHPVKFDGSPTDRSNKVILDRSTHRQEVTPWWNRLQRTL